jgi:predicted dehydrogenase
MKQETLPAGRTLLTRREFLWWSAALGASAALPLGWTTTTPVRLGLVGLGKRGQRVLAACRALPGAEVAALCDRDAAALCSALGGIDLLAGGFATREAQRLFAERTLDAVLLAVPVGEQIELAAAACDAGKDVLLFRPLSPDRGELRRLNEVAARHRRQVHVARATSFGLEPGSAHALLGTESGESGMARVQARFQLPKPPDADALFVELIDELDFAQAWLGGIPSRLHTAGGPGLQPGLWLDHRLLLELTGERGPRRWLDVALTASCGPEAPKDSQIVLTGGRGAARLAGSPLPAGNLLDLTAFLAAVRSRGAGVGLSLPRVLQLVEFKNQGGV